MARALAALFALVLLVTGCDLATGPEAVTNGLGFSARAESGDLVLRNASAVPVRYVAIDEEGAALIDLNPNRSEWPSVAAGAEVRIPFVALTGGERTAERARVYWWSVEGSGTLRVPLR